MATIHKCRIDLEAIVLGYDISKEQLQMAIWPAVNNRHQSMKRYMSGKTQLTETQIRNLLYILKHTDLTFSTLPMAYGDAGRNKPIYPSTKWPFNKK